MSRVIVWFSCGAASAVAAHLALQQFPDAEIVYCDTMASEHPDNKRFFQDVQNWLGKEIRTIKSKKYDTIDDVFEARKYLAGIAGAPCTVEMKKVPRFDFQEVTDRHVFGLTIEEPGRIDDFEKNNPELDCLWILRDGGITKDYCLHILDKAGIATPVMYKLGFRNNNCIGCVKASSIKYWQRVKLHFPEVFAKRAEQSRRFGARLVRLDGERIYLDEMPSGGNFFGEEENVSCGPQCTS